METKKILLGSLVLAGLCASCTNEDIVNVAQNDATLAQRAQVNLALTSSVKSRMSGEGGKFAYTTNDVLGAVLVDNGYKSATGTSIWNNVDWKVSEGHVGNNKWAFNGTKFTTDGTTAVGAWLFYTKYNSKMTTTRNGVEFDFPQIQEGAADYTKFYNNNINFEVSPVICVDGYEGENLEFNIAMNSVYSQLNMKFDFSGLDVTKVQKIVVKKYVGGALANFAGEYTVNNQNLPVAKLSIAARGDLDMIACPTYPDLTDLEEQNLEMSEASKKFYYNDYAATNNVPSSLWTAFDGTQYKEVASKRTGSTVEYPSLVVDFDNSHDDTAGNGGLALTDGKFSGYMLIPAGVYQKLRFEIYTDNGVFAKEVTNRYACAEGLTAEQLTANNITKPSSEWGENLIFLRPGRIAVLSDIENVLPSTNPLEYIKIKAGDEMVAGGDLVTKTADLINFIKGITATGSYDVNIISQEQIGNPGEGSADDEAIPAHSMIINKEVMDAIVEKEEEVGDIQLVFQGAKVLVKGGADAANALDIHDLTFNEHADIIEGFVKATSDVVLPGSENSILTIKGNSTLQLAMNNNNANKLYSIDVKAGSALNVISENKLTLLNNEGIVAIGGSKNKVGSVNTNFLINSGTIRNFNQLTVNTNTNNKVDAQLINAGELTLNKTTINNGTLNNSKVVNVKGEFTNNAEIINGKSGDIIVNSTLVNGSLLNNGEITNNGEIYTVVETVPNVIYNYGLINANEGSLTYITRNSFFDERNTQPTNDPTQVMGTIKIEKRNANIDVTEANYQGYKEYNVAAEDLVDGVLTTVAKDKFNKVILSDATELSAEVVKYVNFVVTSADITVPGGARIQELTFTADASFYCDPQATILTKAIISKLTVEEGVKLTVPTESEMNIMTIEGISTSRTTEQIINAGTILVGGDFYTDATTKAAAKANNPNGVFAAGHGDNTAFHWGEL